MQHEKKVKFMIKNLTLTQILLQTNLTQNSTFSINNLRFVEHKFIISNYNASKLELYGMILHQKSSKLELYGMILHQKSSKLELYGMILHQKSSKLELFVEFV
jgi:hypothetical protein